MDTARSTQELSYRPMEPADYPDAFALWSATDGIHLNPADSEGQVAAYLRQNPQQSFVCRGAGNALLGTVLCGNDGRRAFLYHLAVAQSARGLGIGKALVSLALQRQRQLGIAKCALFVEEGNEPASAFGNIWASSLCPMPTP